MGLIALPDFPIPVDNQFEFDTRARPVAGTFTFVPIPPVMKVFLFSLILCTFLYQPLMADEGMWVPLLLGQKHGDMQAKGLKLSKEEIYNINGTSLKDAIVLFGGGCTGELVSPDGLIFTNHHCGFDAIQDHSSLEHDYLANGFWATSRSEELINPGLSVSFLVRMEDVTGRVLRDIAPATSESERNNMVRKAIQEIEEEAVRGTHYQAKVRPFYYGNEFYLFVTEVYTDVRLVGAPPSSIGKFGGDTDNWMWPRHTGDFSVFRIYAGKDNKPAAYSPENVPFKARKYLPISTKGVKEGDFTMVYGFPGRTQEYITSYALDFIKNVTNPNRILIREKLLAIMDHHMSGSPLVRIKYASKSASLANGWKKWIGENKGLNRLKAIEKKQEIEARFRAWLAQNPQKQEQYQGLLDRFEANYRNLKPHAEVSDFLSETLNAVGIFRISNRLKSYLADHEAFSGPKQKTLLADLSAIWIDMDTPTEQQLLITCLKLIREHLPAQSQPDIFGVISKKFKGEVESYVRDMYKHSNLIDSTLLSSILSRNPKKSADLLSRDPAMKLYSSLFNALQPALVAIGGINNDVMTLNRQWMNVLREINPDQSFYPDANSTLRIAYGVVDDYKPSDAVTYGYQTTVAGLLEKEDPAIYDYQVPERLKALIRNKEFGRWGMGDQMPLAFIATNHTTGGNSGSPVLNAQGELIGINFDRAWEGTMSDLMYDPDQCRNISLDVRYLLFILDKFANSDYILSELKLVRD